MCWLWRDWGFATLMYAPITHMQIEPPIDPMRRRSRRPTRSIKKTRKISERTVLTTPKMPVVNRLVFVPVIPILWKTVGL